MKLFEYLKGRLLPPSSRSFHELFSEVIGLRHDICELSRQLESLRADLQHESANAVRSVQACSSAIGEMDSRLAIAADAHDTHMKLMLWSLIAREGETSDDAKRRFFRSLPKELEEAAYVDGATNWKVLWKIILPISKPVLATVTLFVIVNHWNAWFDGLIYLNNPDQYPLQTYLQTQVVSANLMALESLRDIRQIGMISDRTGKAAQIFLAAVPVLMIYPFLQKYFTSGIVMGSVKG